MKTQTHSKKRAPSGAVAQATAVSAIATPLLAYAATLVGHPIPAELLPYVGALAAGVGGWFHANGRAG